MSENGTTRNSHWDNDTTDRRKRGLYAHISRERKRGRRKEEKRERERESFMSWVEMRDRKFLRAISLWFFFFFFSFFQETLTVVLLCRIQPRVASTRRSKFDVCSSARASVGFRGRRRRRHLSTRVCGRSVSREREFSLVRRVVHRPFAGSRRRSGVSRFPFHFGNVKRARTHHVAVRRRSRCRPW